MTQNAACAQYVTTVECLTPPPAHELPVTGLAVAWILLVGLLLIALGTLIRGWLA